MPTDDVYRQPAAVVNPVLPGGRYLPPWAWAVTVLPFGLAQGYVTVAMPYVLRDRGFDMTTIASVSLLSQMPHAIKFFWAPALDAGWRRKSWYFAMIALTAISLGATSLVEPSTTKHFGPFTLLAMYTAMLTLAQAAVATSTAAVLALMATTLPNAVKGRASGWQTMGNLVGTGAGGALALVLLRHVADTTTGLILASLCLAGAVPIFFVNEAPAEKHKLGTLFRDLIQGVWRTLRSREGWTGLVICLSPVGTGALINLFSALAKDYAAVEATRERMVALVTGVAGSLASAGGALVGGYAADRMNRRFAYALFGAVTAMSAIGMMIGPANPTAFTIGCFAYSFANGLCYAVFYAFVLEMVGKGAGVTTKLALFVSASNQAINYVTWLDGWAYDKAKATWPQYESAGREGMLGMDALASFVGIGMLGVMIYVVRRMPKPAAQELHA